MRKILLVLTGLVAALLLAAPVSNAQTTDDCSTFTTTIADVSRPDSSSHGTWATDTYARTITATPDAGCGTWTLEFSDDGTFTTLPAALSPHDGVQLPDEEITGAFTGGQTFTLASESVPHAPTMPADGWPSTSGWVALIFDSPTEVADQGWGWDYVTSCEEYRQAGDGQTGDITRVCPPATTTPPTTTDPTTTTPPANETTTTTSRPAVAGTDEERELLAATGTGGSVLPWLIIAGVLLLGGGGAALLIARRRKGEHQ